MKSRRVSGIWDVAVVITVVNALCFGAVQQVMASDYATEVIEHSSDLDASGPYNDPQDVLGMPATWNSDCNCVSMVCPAWGNDVITTIGNGSYIVVKFDHQVEDDPNNPFGIDFLVFGNSFYSAGAVTPSTDMETCYLMGGAFEEPVLVAVSQDGINWYEYTSGPYGDTGKYPTTAKEWDRTNHCWGALLDFTKPVNPAAYPFADCCPHPDGKYYIADIIEHCFKGSAGGTGFDLAESGYSWIQYIKVYGNASHSGGEIDAFSDVAPATPAAHTLQIVSAYGTVDPAVGTYTNDCNSILTNTVSSPVTQGMTQHVCTGWIMTGNTPFNGTGTNCIMTLTDNAVLTWQWNTQFWLNTDSETNGTLDKSDQWVNSGSNVTVTATADEHYHFTGWHGDTNGCTINANEICVPMTLSRQIQASFEIDNPVILRPVAKDANDSTEETSINLIADDDDGTGWVLDKDEIIWIDSFASAGDSFTNRSITEAKLCFRYNTDAGYNGVADSCIKISIDEVGEINTDADINDNIAVITVSTLIDVTNWSLLEVLDVKYESEDSGGPDDVFIKDIWLEVKHTNAVTECSLQIISAHGTPTPSVGVYTNDYGIGLTNSVGLLDTQGATQHVCTGWTMTGNLPATGVDTNCVMTHTNNAVLTWQWDTQYRLTTVTNGNGTVTAADGWYVSGASTTLTAQAAEHWHFSQWDGDTNGCTINANQIDVPMTMSRQITACFSFDTPKGTVFIFR